MSTLLHDIKESVMMSRRLRNEYIIARCQGDCVMSTLVHDVKERLRNEYISARCA